MLIPKSLRLSHQAGFHAAIDTGKLKHDRESVTTHADWAYALTASKPSLSPDQSSA